MLEIVMEFVIEIVIEIGMEQTRLFQCTLFHYAEKSAKHNSGTTPADFNHDFNHEFNHDFKHSVRPLSAPSSPLQTARPEGKVR